MAGFNKADRTTKQHPCPVCGHAGWCLVPTGGDVVICMYVVEGSFKTTRTGANLHRRTDDMVQQQKGWPCRRPFKPLIPPPSNDDVNWPKVAEGFELARREEWLLNLTSSLGVTRTSLVRLGVGMTPEGNSTFPMWNAEGCVIGVRIRGKRPVRGRIPKWAVTGSHNGLFIPYGLSGTAMALVCEGPTDTAAALDFDYDAIGRASCSTGGDFLAKVLQGRDVAVLADDDDDAKNNPGELGARALAKQLARHASSVRIVFPVGFTDIRSLRQHTSDGNVLAHVIDAAEIVHRS